MTQLYKLGDAYKAIQETDELTDEEITTALANIKEVFVEKAGNIGKLMLSWKSDIKALMFWVLVGRILPSLSYLVQPG